MKFIIYDLEATCWQGGTIDKLQEIIEIGACRMTRYGEIEDEFSKLVRPVLNPVLSAYCRELTSIDQIEVNRAETFPVVIDEFIEWAGIDTDEYLLCSWGAKDKLMLAENSNLHHLEDDWLDPHLNVKHQYHEMKRLRRRRGLKHAVEAEGFEFTGDHHRALADATNLAKIFLKYLDEWRY